jgi:tellurite resistance protein TerC
MSGNISLWVGFNSFVVLMLLLDLFVFNRKEHAIKVKEALLWTLFWFSLAALFATGIYLYYPHGAEKASEFAAGYLIEQSLSVDNLFVIMMLFTIFRTPHAFQHKVLFWGILGAIFFRILFILLGIALISRFSFFLYFLGAFLVYTAINMFFSKDEEINPEKNIAIRIFRRIMPVTLFYEGSSFFVRKDMKLHATPLFVVMLVVETTDIVFAVDSIPAVLAISNDPFIVYSSNIFAVLGLRSMYFALAGIMELFHFLKYGLSIILMFIGVKIILEHSGLYSIPTSWALIVVAGLLLISIGMSLLFPEKKGVPAHHAPDFPVKEPNAPKDH